VDPEVVKSLFYIAASILFVFGLKMLGSPATARKGNLASAAGMLLAVLTTLATMTGIQWFWIIGAAGIGSVIGALAARLVKMTSMPQMVGLFNGFGGLASLLVGWSEFHVKWAALDAILSFTMLAIFFTVLAGAVTFTGSLVAYGRLSGVISGKPLLYKGRNIINLGLLIAILTLGILFLVDGAGHTILYVILGGVIILSLILGVLTTIGIGGADMPVIICLLDSYSGLAACAAGFVISNNVFVSGSLVGASGHRLCCRRRLSV